MFIKYFKYIFIVKQWNKIFKKEGKFFTKVQKDIPKFANLLKKNKVKKILDLGSGSGRHTVYLAKRGFEVFGIDIAQEGINITKNWLKKENLKADLKIGNIYKKLPYPNDFFDTIISTGVICHNNILGIRKIIKEMERILKPQGFIFINVRKNRKYTQKLNSKKILPFGKENTLCKITGPRTCVPLEGGEKGLIHYSFTKQALKKEFKNFDNQTIWLGSDKRHLYIIGRLKKKN